MFDQNHWYCLDKGLHNPMNGRDIKTNSKKKEKRKEINFSIKRVVYLTYLVLVCVFWCVFALFE